MYTLIGSLTSPYVRRFRMYLRDVPHKLDAVNYFEAKDDAKLSAINPLKRIPVVQLPDGRAVWESRVIHAHIARALGRPAMTLEEENAVSAVDTLQDQLVQAFLMKKFGHAVDRSNPYFQRHADRQKLMLGFLESEVEKGRFARWDYPAMSLYALIDWSLFREALRAEEIPAGLKKWQEQMKSQPLVTETDPRKA